MTANIDHAKDEYPAADVLNVLFLKTITLVVPLLGTITETFVTHAPVTLALAGKWFILSAVGLRLAGAGFRHIGSVRFSRAYFVARREAGWQLGELSLTNLAIGGLSVLSYCLPPLRLAMAVSGIIYFGLSAWQQTRKGVAGITGWLAWLTDVVVCLALIGFLVAAEPGDAAGQ